MDSLRVLAFDHEGRPVGFDTWLDDLQLYLLSDTKDSVSLFDHVSGAATAPPATADSATRSQWLSRDAAARLAICNHLPVAECAHFGQHMTAHALYDAVVAHYSSPATAALGRLLLPYLFLELSAFATVEDLVSHLHASDARYRAALPAEDHFLSLDPTSLTIDLLEQHLLTAETSAVAVGAARGTPRPPFFEGCSPSPLAPSHASAAAVDVSVAEDVGAASASAKRRSSKSKGGKVGGGDNGDGGGGSGSSGGGSDGGSGGSGTGGESGESGGSSGSGGSGGGGTGGGGTGTRRVGSGGGQRQQQQRRSETQSPQQLHMREASHSAPRLDDAWRADFGDDVELPRWADLLRSKIAIFDLDFDAILFAMYSLSVSAEGDCYRCVPPDPGIATAALGASESGTLPGSSLYTLATEPPQVAASAQVSASGQVAASCSCRLLSHQTLLWHHRVGHPSLPRLCGMHSRLLVSGLPSSLPPLPPSPAPPCLPCVEGRQRAAPHSSSFPPTTAPLQTLHMDVWGPARVSGQGRGIYFLLVVDDYTRYTMVFPLPSKGQVVDVLIPWIRAVRLQLRARFCQDLPILRMHSDRGGEFSSDLLRDFCCWEGIRQSFTLPDFPQQNGIAERRIGLVMEVTRTSMIHAAAPHFLWWFAPRVSLPETSPALRWTGEVGDASVFRVWGSRAFVRDTSTDKLSARAIPCVFLGFVPDAPGWQFYHLTSRRVFPSEDVMFDELVPFYRLFPYRSAPPPPPPLFLAPGPPPVAVGSGAAPSVASGGAEPGGAESEGAGSRGAEPGGEEPAGAKPAGVETGGVEPGGAESGGQLREWFVRRACIRSEAPGAGVTGAAGAGSARVTAGAGGTGGTAATGPGGARTKGTGAAGTGGVGGGGAGDPAVPGAAGAGGTGAGGVGAAGAGAVDPGPGRAGGTVWSRLYFIPLLQQPASPLPAPSPYTEQSGGLIERRELASHPVSPVHTTRRVPRSHPPPVPGTHAMALCPSSVPLPPPLQSSLPEVPDPESDRACAASPTVARLLATAATDPSFESAAASALVAELLDFAAACRLDYATALVAESVTASPPSIRGECALGMDVLEDRQEDFECLAAAVPHFASMLLAPEGDLDAPDIPTPRSYAEAITGPYSSQWQAAMDAEMESWKSTGTYVDEVPPPRANTVDGMWIFMVKWPAGSPLVFKARYVARGFSQRQGVDYFQTFSPTPKMTTLWVLLHVTAQRDYELHSLDFSIAFLQGSLHKEIWLRCPPGFTESFPAGASRVARDTLMTTLAALALVPATANPSLFLRTDTSLPPFYVLVYVDDLVFATADTEALTLAKTELQKRGTCTDLGELRSYLGLQITRDRARRTITLTQSHVVHQVLQCFGFQFSLPQPTPLSTSHSLSAPPSDESVEPSGPYPELVGCLMHLMTCTGSDLAYPLSLLARYVAPGRHRKVHWDAAKRVLHYLCSTSGMGLVLGGRGPVVLTGHADTSWVDDSDMQRSSQGYTLSLGSGSVSWRSTRSFSVLSSSCEVEIYAGAMAVQELRWLTYLLTDLGEQPRSPPILYVDNKAMIALCQELRMEHRTKHIALRYFLARELQQRGHLRLAYVATRANTADIFTKALPPGDHQRFSTVLGIVHTLPHLLTT
ncbi:unnamed protein product [Closterium sp. NIES-54]